MTTGASGSYGINGVDLQLQPTAGRWIPRESIGFTGDGHPDYVGVREFEMTWQLISADDVNQLQNFFDTLGLTGTAVVDLPKYRNATYIFESYSGCAISEPQMDAYYEQHETSITLLIYGIVTG
jgi:hypothetical protein